MLSGRMCNSKYLLVILIVLACGQHCGQSQICWVSGSVCPDSLARPTWPLLLLAQLTSLVHSFSSSVQLIPRSPSGPHATRAASLQGMSFPSLHCCVSFSHLEAQMQGFLFSEAFPAFPLRASHLPPPCSALHSDSTVVFTGPQATICGRARLPHWSLGSSRKGQVLLVAVTQ